MLQGRQSHRDARGAVLALFFCALPLPGLAQQAAPGVMTAVAPAAAEAQMAAEQPEASPPSLDDPGLLRPATSQEEQAYDDHIRNAFVAAQSQEGPLEGAWQILDVQGRNILKLELVDARTGILEGAWYDSAALPGQASGLIDDLLREQGGGFLAHIIPPGTTDLLTLDLKPAPGGQLAGVLMKNNTNTPIVMNRDPDSLGASALLSASAQPYNPAAARPAAKAPVKKAVRKAPAKKKPVAKKPAAKPAAKAPAKK